MFGVVRRRVASSSVSDNSLSLFFLRSFFFFVDLLILDLLSLSESWYFSCIYFSCWKSGPAQLESLPFWKKRYFSLLLLYIFIFYITFAFRRCAVCLISQWVDLSGSQWRDSPWFQTCEQMITRVLFLGCVFKLAIYEAQIRDTWHWHTDLTPVWKY